MIRLALLLICIPIISLSQVFDDFSDGNFNSNPQWNGSSTKFKVNDNFQLQLNDTAAGIAFLTTANSMSSDCEWRFWIKQSFSPSSNNNGRVYLLSNSNNLTGSLNGYFIQLGESGSNDAIELFRQNGFDVFSVCRGTEGLISSSFAMGFKVTRDENGNWNIFVDKENNGTYLPEASGIDNTFTQTGYFGFFAKYTSSNAKKFYWDDVYVGEIIVDNQPPEVEFITALSDSTLIIQYNEPPDEVSATNITNYNVDNNIGNPASIALTGTQVALVFSSHFQNGVTYHISISNIADLSGNIMENFTAPFSYYVAQPGDVVFNEIFPDPNPPVGLPVFEFIELYNRTESVISLNNWTLSVGSSEKPIDNAVISPKGFLLLGKIDAQEELSQFGSFYGFSSFSLTNSGQTLVLTNKNGEIIDDVSYKETWYRDPDKEDGGWTLEKINPDNICSGSENWKASVDVSGGTPGTVNSVFSNIFLQPALSRYELVGNDVLQLEFNQKMDKNTLANINNYFIDNGIGNPFGAYPDNNDASKVGLFFENGLEEGVSYSLTLKKDLKNCIGVNLSDDTVVIIGTPEKIKEQDIIINEILYNPLNGGEDYVEIYNRSGKLLDISQIKLGTVKISPPNPPDTLFYEVASEQTIIFPDNYFVFTKSPDAVKSQYYTNNPNAFLRVDPFPSYNNESGTVILKTDSIIIDAFTYNDAMQYPLLNYTKGVSLERIDPDTKTNDKNNWHSAAESVGFGTPGYKNSQFIEIEINKNEITVEPEVFSPDNDGNDDVVKISYNFNEPGFNISIAIYNRSGMLVRRLTDNEYVGTSGTVFWNGITDDNTKAITGIYIIYIKVFNSNGKIKSWKETVVLATKW